MRLEHFVVIAQRDCRKCDIPYGIVVGFDRGYGGRRLKPIPDQRHQHKGEAHAQQTDRRPNRDAGPPNVFLAADAAIE